MTVTGAVKVLGVPDDLCLTSVRDLVLALQNLLTVEFDESLITNVVVSSTEPEGSNRNVVWFKLNASGNFSGIYVFSQGQWLKMFPVTQQLFRVYGDSRVLDPGYALVEEGVAGITSTMYTAIEATWTPHPTDSGVYIIFDVVYVGL
jgi:hypothetical protein